MKGWVTVYSDASWHDKDKAAGWAYLIRSEYGWYKKSGNKVPDWVRCSNSAEMAAIVAGIYRALREWPDTIGVGVRTDSRVAIDYLRYRPNGFNGRRPEWMRVRTKLHELLDEFDCRIRMIHVKGHRPRHESSAAKLNGSVDYWSREARLGRKFIDQSHEDVEVEKAPTDYYDYYDLGFGLDDFH